MKIVLAVVMQTSDSSEEADFTTVEERQHMTEALEALGHAVVPVDVSAPLADVVAAIERNDPDVVFNTVEQVRGESPPAGFVPAICGALRRRCSGPGPRAIAIGSDKWLTKRVVPPGPVPFAEDALVRTDRPWDDAALADRYPLLAKPNHGGSSQGITADSLARSPAEVETALRRLAPFLDAGVLVERFIPGRDLTVGCVQQDGAWRVLAPIEYATPATHDQHFLTEGLKRWDGWDEVVPRAADLSPQQRGALEEQTLSVVRAVGANGAARVDFRLSDDDGRLTTLELNAIVNVEPGAGMVLSAEHAGLGYHDLVALMVETAR